MEPTEAFDLESLEKDKMIKTEFTTRTEVQNVHRISDTECIINCWEDLYLFKNKGFTQISIEGRPLKGVLHYCLIS